MLTKISEEKEFKWTLEDNYCDINLRVKTSGEESKYQSTDIFFSYPGSHSMIEFKVNGKELCLSGDSGINIHVAGGYERVFLYKLAKCICTALEG